MLKWSPKERGKDPKATPSDCFSQLELLLQLKVIYPPSPICCHRGS